MGNQYEAMAHSILSSVQSNFTPEHEYAPANARSFKGLDLKFYEKTQSALEALRFVVAADVEDKTISSAGSIKTFIRVMHHPESAATAAVFYVSPLKKGFVEFETLFSNDHFVVDTNSPASISITAFPMIEKVHYSPTASLEAMYKAHTKRVHTFLSKRPGVEVQTVSNFDSIARAQNLMNKCKHDHLASIGWITLEFLEKQTNGDAELASGIYTAIQNILKGGGASSNPSSSEQAVIVHFKYGNTNLGALFALEDKLEKAVEKVAGAQYDGHEIAVDGSDGRLYMYGPDADKLFLAVAPVLKRAAFMKGARAVKRYGPPEDGVRETEVEIGDKQQAKPKIDLDAPLSPEADKFLAEATAEFNTKQEALRRDWRFDSFTRWEYDDKKGILKLSFKDGAELRADGQLLGTYSPSGHSFEWAWNSPHFGDTITQGSKLVRERGKHLGIDYLQAGMIPIPADVFLSYIVAIGTKVTDSLGIFRADGGGVDVLIAVKNARWTKKAA